MMEGTYVCTLLVTRYNLKTATIETLITFQKIIRLFGQVGNILKVEYKGSGFNFK